MDKWNRSARDCVCVWACDDDDGWCFVGTFVQMVVQMGWAKVKDKTPFIYAHAKICGPTCYYI